MSLERWTLNPLHVLSAGWCLGGLLLLDALFRLRNYSLFYGEEGLLKSTVSDPAPIDSAHLLLNSVAWTQIPSATWKAGLGLQCILALIMLSRRWMPLAAILAAIWILILRHRFSVLTTGWDSHLPWLLIWIAALNCSFRLPRPLWLQRCLYGGFISHLGLVYTTSAWSKYGVTWQDGTAVLNAVTTPLIGRLTGSWSSLVPQRSVALTLSIVWLENVGWLGLLLPWRGVRRFIVTVFLIFHMLAGLSLHLGFMTFSGLLLWWIVADFLPRPQNTHLGGVPTSFQWLVIGPLGFLVILQVWIVTGVTYIRSTSFAEVSLPALVLQGIGLQTNFHHFGPDFFHLPGWPVLNLRKAKRTWDVTVSDFTARSADGFEEAPLNYSTRVYDRDRQRLIFRLLGGRNTNHSHRSTLYHTVGRRLCQRFPEIEPDEVLWHWVDDRGLPLDPPRRPLLRYDCVRLRRGRTGPTQVATASGDRL